MTSPSRTGRLVRISAVVSCLETLGVAGPSAQVAQAPSATTPDAVGAVVNDYVGLYRKDTLAE